VEQFKIGDASSYDSVAASFAHFTNLVTRPLSETMVRMAELRSENRILDIGTGSGIVALTAAKHLNGPGSVTGIDLSDGLLAEARQAAVQAGLADKIRLEKADAEALPLRDKSFDVVLSLFALLHFPHPDKAVAEMFRVLAPGGRLVIGIGSQPPWNSVKGWTHRLSRIPDFFSLKAGKLLLAPAHLNQIVERHLPAAAAAEETELAQDHAYRSARAVKLIRETGFQDVRTDWEGHHLVLDTALEFWDLQSTFSSLARKRLRTAAPAQLDLVHKDFERQCADVIGRGGKLVYHYAASYISGRRPR
jgi:ubiquinone/menaquinone biosynthesis C-methylase UbiE